MADEMQELAEARETIRQMSARIAECDADARESDSDLAAALKLLATYAQQQRSQQQDMEAIAATSEKVAEELASVRAKYKAAMDFQLSVRDSTIRSQEREIESLREQVRVLQERDSTRRNLAIAINSAALDSGEIKGA